MAITQRPQGAGVEDLEVIGGPGSCAPPPPRPHIDLSLPPAQLSLLLASLSPSLPGTLPALSYWY